MKKPALLLTWILISACSSTDSQEEVEELMPLTAANMRGHQYLYEDGWLIVTSTKDSLGYAKNRMGTKSREALVEGGDQFSDAGQSFVSGVGKGAQNTSNFLEGAATYGAEKTSGVFIVTHEMAKSQIELSGWLVEKSGVTMWQGVKAWPGHAYDSGKAVVTLPRNIAVDTYSHVKNTVNHTNEFNERVWESTGKAWRTGLNNAGDAHKAGVKAGTESNNSLVAIFPVMWGNVKSAYFALVKPVAKTGAATVVSAGSYGAYVPVSSVAGASWYTAKHTAYSGYKVGELAFHTVAPPVTGAALGAGAAVTASTVPVTYAIGGAAGTATGLGIAGASIAGSTAYVFGNTGFEIVTLAGKGVYVTAWQGGKIAFNQVSSVMVLGYNAATAVPTHSLMAVTDVMCIAVYDGPHALMKLSKG